MTVEDCAGIAAKLERGIVAATKVPLLGLDVISSLPPNWRMRSLMPCMPTPRRSTDLSAEPDLDNFTPFPKS